MGLTDNAGVVQTQYTYEPFGATTASGGASTNPLQFTGRENDGTGLHYNRARYYDPVRQRFISEDPVRFAEERLPPGVRETLHAAKLTWGELEYTYARNGPLTFTDPLGLSAECAAKATRDQRNCLLAGLAGLVTMAGAVELACALAGGAAGGPWGAVVASLNCAAHHARIATYVEAAYAAIIAAVCEAVYRTTYSNCENCK